MPHAPPQAALGGDVLAKDSQQRDDWVTPQSRVPQMPQMARANVSHEEVFSGSDAETSDGWPEPEALFDHLVALAAGPVTGGWAKETAQLLRELGPAISSGSAQATSIIGRLDELTAEVGTLASRLPPGTSAGPLLRAGYALNRRLDVWRQIVGFGPSVSPSAETVRLDPNRFDPERLSWCLDEIEAITGGSATGKAWREYLLVDALRGWLDGNPTPGEQLPPALARRVLGRLTQVPMEASQRQFISSTPVAALQSQLERRLAEPVDLVRLLQHLERYEQTELASDARRLTEDCRDLYFSASEDHHRLADTVQTHYRNANLRLAITAELLNRLMPEREPEHARVRERVLGLPVYGRSVTDAEVSLRLLPDPNHVRMALEIVGTVASLTSSTSGPATFISNGRATYTASKPLRLDLQGIHLGPSEVRVSNRLWLRNVRTDFDGVPLISSVVKGIARSGHERNREAATRETKQKIAAKARKRIDTEASARLDEVSQGLQQRVLEPLAALSLDPTMIRAQTTERRLTMRLRLAGRDQLGGHTPRPRAPSDSLASFQVHQSAINNVLERLQLDGRTFTLPELTGHIASRFCQSEPLETDPAHDDVKITFARQDAAAVRFEDGRVTLTLAIAKLYKSRRQQWEDFKVRVVFRPEIDACSAGLVRDGIIHLEGPGVGTRSRFALSGIFSQMFSKHRPFYLTPDQLADHPKLADLALTQFHVDDGWLGVALGKKRPVERTVLRRK